MDAPKLTPMTAVLGAEHLTLGQRLAFARQLAGIEQQAFAPMLGVARPALSSGGAR